MNLTNKKIILIYVLSPFMAGVFFGISSIFYLPENVLSPLMIHINVPLGFLIDYLQMISITSGTCYAYVAISFLFLFVIPSKLVSKLTAKKNKNSRLIKVVLIVIGLIIFLSLERIKFHVFLSNFWIYVFYIVAYVVFFLFIPKKITGIPKNTLLVDQFIHMLLSELIGVTLYFLWKGIFPDNIKKSVFLVFDTSYFTGLFAVILFFIFALIVGIVKIENNHLDKFKQIRLCGIVGFLGPFLATVLPAWQLGIAFGVVGCITAMLVTIIVNLINTPPVKQLEEINHQ